MWSHEESIETSASPARVWSILADVPRWPRWNAGIDTIELHGPFATGTSFSMRLPGEDIPLRSVLLDVAAHERFVDETLVGDVRVVVSHEIVPMDINRTMIVYRTEVTGPDAADVGAAVTADFPDVLRELKRVVEAE